MPDIGTWMADQLRSISLNRDVEQAITALKKGAYLLKYGRRGKPKFCPFRLSNDESVLIWYSGKDEKQLILSHVSKIIPGQRTAIFQRYPRPDKEYQSFSLICNDRSLDLICKDKDEAEVWFVGLKALISHGNYRACRSDSKGDWTSFDGSVKRKNSIISPFCSSDIFHSDSEETKNAHVPSDNPRVNGLGKVFSNVALNTAAAKCSSSDSVSKDSPSSGGCGDNSNGRGSASDAFRVSLSSAVSSSSLGSGPEDFDALGDVFLWGEDLGDGFLRSSRCKIGSSYALKVDASLPKALESAVVLDVHNIACGEKHAVLVTKKGEIFSWGEESGGRLGHGVDADVTHPKLINALCGMNIELVACGQYHTCAVTSYGDLYTWGDCSHNSGLLGHGSEASHWIPKQVAGPLEGLHVSSVSCGPWHTAVVTSSGQLFTFGDGTFGALGHGDRMGTNIPREVEALRGMHTVRVACGAWHSAAVVEITVQPSNYAMSSRGKLFTWGDGDKGRLGHGDREHRLIPECVTSLSELSFCQVVCGCDMTIALTTTGRVYTMGSNAYGQLGNSEADSKAPNRVEGKLSDCFVEEIRCGSYHAAVLTSGAEVYTWGKGASGQLGHGDNDDRATPTLVAALKDKQVKNVVCGSNFNAVICIHKWVSSVDQSMCSGCRLPFGFRRKLHNCYNCGIVFCKACSSRKSLKASLAPNLHKPYRVCDDCFVKLKKSSGQGLMTQISKNQGGSHNQLHSEVSDKEGADPKLRPQISRLSSVDSFKGHARHSWKCETNGNRSPPASTDSSPFRNLSKSMHNRSSKIMFSASVPVSRIGSRSTSPVSWLPSPSNLTTALTVTDRLSSELVFDDSRNMDNNLNQEVIRLKFQVEELTKKSQFLEAELERTARQLREATADSGEEIVQSKAAKVSIKALNAQLRDIVEEEPKGLASDGNRWFNGSHIPNLLAVDSISSGRTITSRAPESDGCPVNPLIYSEAPRSADEIEWVEQAEPGVYLTVSLFPGGEKFLKRVRFSRKRFSEQQAENWWAENKEKIQHKYSFEQQRGAASRSISGLPESNFRN